MKTHTFCLPDPERVKEFIHLQQENNEHIADRRLTALEAYFSFYAIESKRVQWYAFEQLPLELPYGYKADANSIFSEYNKDFYLTGLEHFLQEKVAQEPFFAPFLQTYKNPIDSLAAILCKKTRVLYIRPKSVVSLCLENDSLQLFQEIIVIVGQGAHVTIKDSMLVHTKPHGVTSVRVYMDENARVSWLYKQQLMHAAYGFISYAFFLQTNSELWYGMAVMPGASATMMVDVVLQGAHAQAFCGGFYILHGKQRYNLIVRQEHEAQYTHSVCIMNGTACDTACVRYEGTIHIPLHADYSTAKQSNKTILESNSARATCLPQLEAYAPHIACQHGSAVGQIFDEALYYLQSRGICKQEGRNLIVRAVLLQGCQLGDAISSELSEIIQSYF